MKRSLYVLISLLLLLITSCKDNQEIVSPGGSGTQTIEVSLLNFNSGEQVVVGSSQLIKWYSNTTNTIYIDYSTNGGSTWDSLAANVPNTGLYAWTPVPSKISSNCLLRVHTNDNPAVYTYSKTFGIIADTSQKAISLLAPNTGSVVYVDSVYTIRWSSKGIASIKISLSTNNGSTWNIIAPSVPADSSYYSWKPGVAYQSSQCLMRISDVAADSVFSKSSGVFSIAVPQDISITQPNGGETVYAGQSYSIKWTSSQISNVKIEYTTNNGVNWSLITSSTPSNGFYSWDPVPSTISNNCKIRISDVTDGFPVVTSSTVFSIAKAPTLKVLSPNGGEKLLSGSSTYITWSSESATVASLSKKSKKTARSASISLASSVDNVKNTNSGPVTNVKIEYTTNDGASWNSITENTSNNGSYKWDTIPAVNSSLCKIRVSDVNGGIPTDESDNDFTIYTQVQKSIKVTSPNGGESWQSGAAQNITWASSGVAAVKIDYTTNNGVDWKPITASAPSNGYYSWSSIPAVTSTNCKVRITDAGDSTVSDMSDAVFSITPEPAIIVTAPNGGEVYQTGSIKQIAWTSTSIANVKIEYTVNGGADWKTIVADTVSNGIYNWTVPNESTAQAKVKVSKAGSGVPYGVSASNFTITNQVTKTLSLTSPKGGEVWQAGTNQNITWSGTGVANVKLEYTIDNGLNWTTIASSVVSSGSYQWNPIPNIASTQCKVRVSDVVAGGPNDESKSAFTISPVQTIKVISPNGGEVFTAGDADTIKWSSTGIENVKIEYTTNNGLTPADWQVLVASTPSNGVYVTGFSVASTKYKVRISDASDGSPIDESDGVFTVNPQPSVKVLSPNGGENYLSGSSQNITWTSTNVTNVKIEYTINNGATWSVIVADTVSSGLYKWTVPAVNSSLCKVRVSNSRNSGIPSAMSADNFTINQVAPGITVTAPNGGESWNAGSAQVITWSSLGVTNVKIEYTTDNGTNWSTVANSVPSNGYYSWNPVPNTPSTNCKVKISDVSNNYIGLSAQTFTIAPEPAITVTSPAGGEVYQTGAVKPITWISQNVARVKIEYTINNGADWKTVTADTPSIGSFSWTVPNENTTQARVRVSKAGTGVPFGISPANFTISNQVVKQLAIVTPNGGETWNAGTSQQIKWSGTGVANVKIEYSTNNGIGWNTIIASTPSSGAYSWDPIPNITSSQCLVRISDAASGTPSVVSAATFTINPVKSIVILKPVAGDVWTAGIPDTIKWTSTGLSNVKIEYTVNNGVQESDWNVLTPSTPSNGTYVTGFSVASTLYKVRISGLSSGDPSVQSNGTFTVLEQPSVTVLTPKNGDAFVAGTTQNITWQSTNITNVKIEYTINNGATWSVIVADTVSSGLYKWTVPSVNSSLCKIRISNSKNNGIPSAMSAGSFTINQVAPGITVTSPNGGEVWDAGSAQSIKWTSQGVSNVKIDLTTDGGVSWSNIAANVPSNGLYSWNSLPNISSGNCLVKVSDVNQNYYDQSDAPFTIAPKPSIVVTSPNGGENLLAGSTKNITWTATNIAKVKLEYTTNGGANWIKITDSTESTGSYAWTVPNVNSSLCRVKVSEARNGIPYAISADNFTIYNQVVKDITLTSPVGGENWQAGTHQPITWKATGISKVNIYYTVDGGSSWTPIIQNLASTGAYEWGPVPDTNSTQCKIRIADSTGTPQDESKNVFTISPVPYLQVTSPNGGENWVGGSVHNITWASRGVANVKIESTSDNGMSWQTVVASTPSNGSYTWSSSVPSQYYKIRVINTLNNGVPSDESDGVFTILPEASVTVVSPNGGENWLTGETYEIRWKSANIANVKIEYTLNNGNVWNLITPSVVSNGLYNWPVPDTIAYRSDLCKIRITEVGGLEHSDISDGFFSLHPQPKLLRLTAPNGGESYFPPPGYIEIRWVSAGVEKVRIDYTLDNGSSWDTLVPSMQSTGAYDWYYGGIISALARIRITDVSSDAGTNPVTDESDSYFSINANPNPIKFTPGTGYETVNGVANIKWSAQKEMTTFKLEYTTDNGATWNVVANNIANRNGSAGYKWRVPAELTGRNIQYRVTDVSSGKSAVSRQLPVK